MPTTARRKPGWRMRSQYRGACRGQASLLRLLLRLLLLLLLLLLLKRECRRSKITAVPSTWVDQYATATASSTTNERLMTTTTKL